MKRKTISRITASILSVVWILTGILSPQTIQMFSNTALHVEGDSQPSNYYDIYGTILNQTAYVDSMEMTGTICDYALCDYDSDGVQEFITIIDTGGGQIGLFYQFFDYRNGQVAKIDEIGGSYNHLNDWYRAKDDNGIVIVGYQSPIYSYLLWMPSGITTLDILNEFELSYEESSEQYEKKNEQYCGTPISFYSLSDTSLLMSTQYEGESNNTDTTPQNSNVPDIVQAVFNYESVWMPANDTMEYQYAEIWFQDADMDGKIEFLVGISMDGSWSTTVYKYLNGILSPMETTYEETQSEFGYDNTTLVSKGSGLYYIVSSISDGAAIHSLVECSGYTTSSGKQILGYSTGWLLYIMQHNGTYTFESGNGGMMMSQEEAITYYDSYFNDAIFYRTNYKADFVDAYAQLSQDEKLRFLNGSFNAWRYAEDNSIAPPFKDLIDSLRDDYDTVSQNEEILTAENEKYIAAHYDYLSNIANNYWYREYTDNSTLNDVHNVMKFDFKYGELADSNINHLTADLLTFNIGSLYSDLEASQNIISLSSEDVYDYLLAEIILDGYSEVNITENVKANLNGYLKALDENEEKKKQLDIAEIDEEAVSLYFDMLGECTNLNDLFDFVKLAEPALKFNAYNKKMELAIEGATYQAKYMSLIYQALNDITGNLLEALNEMLQTDSIKSCSDLYSTITRFRDAIDTEDIDVFIADKSQEIIAKVEQDTMNDINNDTINMIVEQVITEFIFDDCKSFEKIWTIVKVAGVVFSYEAEFVDLIENMDDVRLYIGNFYACAQMHTVLYDTITTLKEKDKNFVNAYKLHTLLQLYRHTDIAGVKYARRYMRLFYDNSVNLNSLADVIRGGKHAFDSLFNPFDPTIQERFTEVTGYNGLTPMHTAVDTIKANLSSLNTLLYSDEIACCEDVFEERLSVSQIINQEFQKIFAGCPVNVIVYKDEEMIATISDESIIVTDDEYRYLFNVVDEIRPDGSVVETKAKIINLPKNERYSYSVKAVDSGEMTLLSYDISLDKSSEEMIYCFENISLEKGDEYFVIFEADNYVLNKNTDGDRHTIPLDSHSTPDSQPKESVSLWIIIFSITFLGIATVIIIICILRKKCN